MNKAVYFRQMILSLMLIFIASDAYSFWIWSPKTQKWKNPQYSALATPYLQFKEAERMFQKEEYKQAYVSFRRLLANYPDSQEAAEAQFFLAQCLEKMSKPYEAYTNYQKLIDSYPNSQRINEAVERIYNIGEYFLNREQKKLLGMSVYDFVNHPAIEIFQKIVDSVPYSEYAARSQYKLGMIFMQLGRFDEARDAFQKTIDSYSDSAWAAPAKYQLALATAKAFPGAEYDSTYLRQASARLDEFIKEHPEADISSQARQQLQNLRDNEAKKIFEIAQFYEKQNKYESALIYYRKIISDYPDTAYHERALERAKDVDVMIKRDLTMSEYEKQKKLSLAQDEKEQVRRDKDEQRETKLALKRSKVQDSLSKIEDQDSLRESLLREKNIQREELSQARSKEAENDKISREIRAIEKKQAKELARQISIEKKEKQRAKKEVSRIGKLREKEEVRQKKIRRQEAAKIAKETAAREKFRAKEEARLAKIDRREESKRRKEALRSEKLREKTLSFSKKDLTQSSGSLPKAKGSADYLVSEETRFYQGDFRPEMADEQFERVQESLAGQ